MIRRVSRRVRKQQGSVTVEYALIFPLVVFCVIFLIYFGFLYYQQALLQSVVCEHVRNEALLWGYDDRKTDPETGIMTREGYLGKALYWNVFADNGRRREAIRDSILRELRGKSILSAGQNIEAEVTFENYLIIQKVSIRAAVSYPLPLESFLHSVGLPGDLSLEAYAETTVQDPKEFIHNVDYLLQLYDETGAKDWVMEKCRPIVNSLQKIREYLK